MRITGPGTAEPVTVLKPEALQPVPEFDKDKAPSTGEQDGLKNNSANSQETERVREAADFTNNTMQAFGYYLQFKVHKESGHVSVSVVDTQTDKVIREIPPEQLLKLADQIRETLKGTQKTIGALVDELA